MTSNVKEISPKDLVVLERRVVFWEEYKRGKTFRQIAEENDVHPSTVSSDIKALVKELQNEGLRHVEEFRIVQMERIAVAINAIWEHVLRGDVASVNTLIRLLERESRLLGLDAPTKIDITAKLAAMARDSGVPEQEAYDIAEGVYKDVTQ